MQLLLNGDSRIGLVRDDLNEEVRLILNLVWVHDGLIADLVKRIGGIRNQLSPLC
jgi:hypothetical protein